MTGWPWKLWDWQDSGAPRGRFMSPLMPLSHLWLSTQHMLECSTAPTNPYLMRFWVGGPVCNSKVPGFHALPLSHHKVEVLAFFQCLFLLICLFILCVCSPEPTSDLGSSCHCPGSSCLVRAGLLERGSQR